MKKKSDFEKSYICPHCGNNVSDKPKYDPKLKRFKCSKC
jgi:DNA-directed RNA polymerase subunit RPC12/RpoP